MSRLPESDCDGEFNPWNGWYGRAISGRATNAMLKAFLAHLDAMPVKRIALDRIYDPKTGDMCAVGEFARMRGVPIVTIEEKAKESVDDVECNGHEDWTDGPTVELGKTAGLPMTIAAQLAATNDNFHYKYLDVQGPPTPEAARWAIFRDVDGIMHYQLTERFETSPEERWHDLRQYIVELIKESDERLAFAEIRRNAGRAAAS